MDQLLFTPASVLDFLSQIDELKDIDVGMIEDADGRLQIQIGESTYRLDDSNAVTIQVDKNIIDKVDDVNLDTYDNLDDRGDVEISQDIESGIIKEIAKTLLVGGLVRLTKKLLK